MLDYFHERFDKARCKGTCDNCRHAVKTEQRDVSSHGQAALSLLGACRARLTLTMAVDALKGSKTQQVSS